QWVLFHPDAPSASIGGLPGDPGWWWMGLGAVRRESKEKSRYLAALGQRAYGAGDLAGALELSRKAVDSYAFNHTARRTLIHALDGLGRKAEAVEESRRLGSLVDPGVKVSAEFDETLVLLGYTMEHAQALPGEDVKVRFFWRVKRDPGRKERIGVLVLVE